MRAKTLVIAVAAAAMSSPLSADIISQGLDLSAARALTALTMTNVDREDADGTITIRVSAENAKDMKGYGFVVAFDPERFTYVDAAQPTESLISPNGNDPLLVAKNHEPGKVAVGAIQVDGSSASGTGNLIELTFLPIGEIGLADFRLTEGVVVDLAGRATSVTPSVLEQVRTGPADFGLSQNVPNPFNPETTISYQIPEAGRVVLTVYTSLGQEVRTLVDDFNEVGTYTVRWDGRDAVGRQVASGIYFYRMRAGDFVDSKRMMLLK